MIKKILFVVILIASVFIYKNYKDNILQLTVQRELVIYSDLDGKFVNLLADTFSKSKNVNLKAMVLNELNGEKIQADIILTNSYALKSLARAGSLENIELTVLNDIKTNFKDINNAWTGIFYDPVVLLINQDFSRKYGQENLFDWDSLLKFNNIRVVLENFNNSVLQQHLFAAFSSNMGEDEIIDYFSKLNSHVVQYSKYPFTPIRMVVSGDADIAITPRSYIAEYLENDFPAYVIQPKTGTPVTLYGAGIYKGTDSKEEALVFVDWLLNSPEAKNIIFNFETGYEFVTSANTENLWLNTKYRLAEDRNDLLKRWFDEVRFSNNKEENL